MSACEPCWARAFTISRMRGISQVEAYQELISRGECDSQPVANDAGAEDG